MGAAGSPLAARTGSFIYIFILIFVSILVVVAICYFIYLKYREKRKTKAWYEAYKNRETKFADVKLVAREAHLDNDEKQRLWHICRRYHAPNIACLYRDEDRLNELFSQEYNRINEQQPRNEEKISIFFSLRYKLEKAVEQKLSISSTKSLKEEQIITIQGQDKIPWSLKIVKTDAQGFYVSIPEEMKQKNIQPKPLSRMACNFSLKSGIAYQCVLRAARYEKQTNGEELLYFAHSADLHMMQRRKAKRMKVSSDCYFSAVKMTQVQKKKKFEILDKRYTGKLMDISALGCKIWCGLPIVQGQYLQIYFTLEGFENEHEAQGLIVATKKNPDNKTFVLHIKFTDINTKAKNNIYAKIYGYF